MAQKSDREKGGGGEYVSMDMRKKKKRKRDPILEKEEGIKFQTSKGFID